MGGRVEITTAIVPRAKETNRSDPRGDDQCVVGDGVCVGWEERLLDH